MKSNCCQETIILIDNMAEHYICAKCKEPCGIHAEGQSVTDPIVEAVRQKLLERSQLGIKKYGRTQEDNNDQDMLVHLQEELMDACNYIEKLIQQRN